MSETIVRRVLFLAVDVGAGLLLAGAVAPLILILLPEALHGRAFLVATSAVCIAAATVIRRYASRKC